MFSFVGEYPYYDSNAVLLSPSGKVLRQSLPVDVQYNTEVHWTDKSHFQVETLGGLFKFVVDENGLREIVRL